jgi:hypothetical protein
MATVTAHFLVGREHPMNEGVLPTHQLFLSENSVPSLILRPLEPLTRVYEDRGDRPRLLLGESPGPDAAGVAPLAHWHPTVERMLEDALLLLALHVVRSAPLLKAARAVFPRGDIESAALYDVVEAARLDLYEQARQIATPLKLVLTVLRGCYLVKQLDRLDRYPFTCEVCVSREALQDLGRTSV